MKKITEKQEEKHAEIEPAFGYGSQHQGVKP
jgi:hypothetical protein